MPIAGTNGVFCIEGDWLNDLKRPPSVRPILELLTQLPPHPPYIHRVVGTREEFDFFLGKWIQRQYAGYPILYLGFHGCPGRIMVGDQRRSDGEVSLESLSRQLAGRCRGRVMHFGACSTLSTTMEILESFLRRSGALAISGYSTELNWVQSAACDMLVLEGLQSCALTARGVSKAARRIAANSRGLGRGLRPKPAMTSI